VRPDRAFLTRVAPSLRRRAAPAAVLVYHRIADAGVDPWDLAVSPASFEAHLAVLRRRFRPLSLRRLRAGLAEGRLERGSVAVTFDDGYADNLTAAKPLLERFLIPATVFVVTNALESEAEFWWDALERVVLETEVLPATLTLAVAEFQGTWQLEPECDDGEDPQHRGWRAAATPRHRLYLELWKLLRPLRDKDREQALGELRRWASVPAKARQSHRTLSTQEVRDLAGGGLIELGTHTETHPVLALLPVEKQRRELSASRQRLERQTQRPVTALSYPYGGPGDYSRETVAIAHQLGFEIACTNIAGGVSSRTSPLEIPRIYIRNIDPAVFEQAIARWIGKS
jgi:peptidoglycan/xylan/chitin deacetylase (PgdA/CDA1 family)